MYFVFWFYRWAWSGGQMVHATYVEYLHSVYPSKLSFDQWLLMWIVEVSQPLHAAINQGEFWDCKEGMRTYNIAGCDYFCTVHVAWVLQQITAFLKMIFYIVYISKQITFLCFLTFPNPSRRISSFCRPEKFLYEQKKCICIMKFFFCHKKSFLCFLFFDTIKI